MSPWQEGSAISSHDDRATDPESASAPDTARRGRRRVARPAEAAERPLESELVDESELDAKWEQATTPEPVVGYGRPPVVAVVVTKDPGSWFESALLGLLEQDYGRLSVLVVDNASAVDPTPRVAEILPNAFVKRLPKDRGFAAAANEALTAVEGATFLLFLHDDVRLDPGAVTAMVAEAFRLNGGIVGPKLLEWDRPDHISSVGYTIDQFGFPDEYAEPGELDQAQHDIAREVFGVQSAALLVRDDLMRTLGGFDDRIGMFGEDVDLCWRARLAGAAVVVAPAASAWHRSALDERPTNLRRARLELAHATRSMLVCSSALQLLAGVPKAFLLSMIEMFIALVGGRGRDVGDVIVAWGGTVAGAPSAISARGRVAKYRRADESDIRRMQRPGSTRLARIRERGTGSTRFADLTGGSRDYMARVMDGTGRWSLGAVLLTFVIVIIGSRSLFVSGVPAIREFLVGQSTAVMRHEFLSGWRAQGLGGSGAAPGIVGVVGVLGVLGPALAARALVLLPVLLGAAGAWRLLAATGSARARAAAVVVYVGNPLPWNAVGQGHLGALVAWAAAPWVLRMVARDAGLAPFAGVDESTARRPAPVTGTIVRLGVLLGLVAMVNLVAAFVVVVAVVVCHVGQLLIGNTARLGSVGIRVGGAVVVAAALNLPWILTLISRGDLGAWLGGLRANGAVPDGTSLLTLSTGPVRSGFLGLGLLVAAAAAVFAARGRRLGWALGGWVAAVLGWAAAAVATASGGVPLGGGVELLLVPVAVGLMIAVAMVGLAMEEDVVGADFGAPQVAAVAATVGVLLTISPTLLATSDGAWYLPERGLDAAVASVPGVAGARSLWIGEPEVLPMLGWQLGDAAAGAPVGTDRLAVAVTDGAPTIADRYRLDGGPGVELLRSSVGQAMRGGTSRLGRVLASMGIRYVIVPDRVGPAPSVQPHRPAPSVVTDAMSMQLELRRLVANEAVAVYQVGDVQTAPYRIPAEAARGTLDASGLGGADPIGAPRVLTQWHRSQGGWSGSLDPAEGVIVAPVTADAGWRIEGADSATGFTALGWAQGFEVGAGSGRLTRSVPGSHVLLLVVQLALIAAALAYLGRHRSSGLQRFGQGARRRRRQAVGGAMVVVSESVLDEAETREEPAPTDPTHDAPGAEDSSDASSAVADSSGSSEASS